MANNRQIAINLNFTADTQQAKIQLQDLQKTLSSLSKNTNLKVDGLNKTQTQESIASIKELQTHLEKATNIKTGGLDLTKFNKSLATSGKSLTDYTSMLSKMGAEGQQAFLQLGQSILNAEIPLQKTNKLLKDTWDNLKKTAGWQFSSSVIHGLQGAVQSAYYYAEDLNRSLNDIRIVSGKSADEMERFAVQANKAAKNLSATTLDYTNAALIYYQQGLSEDEVIKRTDVTVKMANVTRESTEDVSSYMTAIWNNFDDGSKSMEYYGDVMTALGAATASSTEEIAAALEKFASIGDTVGLSYEYATSAVATVVDKTRQSADSVGTSFRTIFSRLSSLSLGETLDDGVTLTKYTEALNKVGVDALDANGKLRDMDDILDDLGKRWDTLGKSEKNAMAQTVAGVRQYNNLIALLDNYDAFKDNVGVAEGSTGTLQEQADIYAESWEAARNRVRAAMEDIYTSILDDDFFIDMLDFGTSTLKIIDKLIDGVGGLKGILLALSSAMMQVNKNSIARSLEGAIHWLETFSGKTIQKARMTQEEMLTKLTNSMIDKDPSSVTNSYVLQLEQELSIQQMISQHEKNLTTELIEQIKLKKELNDLELDRIKMLASEEDMNSESYIDAKQKIKNIDSKTFTDEKLNEASNNAREKYKELYKKYLGGENKKVNEAFVLSELDIDKNDYTNDLEYKRSVQEAIKALIKDQSKNDFIQDIGKNNKKVRGNNKKFQEILDKMLEHAIEGAYLETEKEEAEEKYKKGVSDINRRIEDGSPETWADNFVTVANTMTTISSLFVTTSSLLSIISDDTMTWSEKLISISSSLPLIISSISQLVTLSSSLIPILSSLNVFFGGAEIAKGTGLLSALFTVIGNGFIPLTMLTIAIGSLILAFSDLKKNSPEEVLKRSSEELKNMQEAAENASNAYDDLNSNLEKLSSAKETLSSLTEGTLEWKQAVLEINQQVLDLIEKYPELSEYLTNENGVLGINEEGIDKVLNQQWAESVALQQASMYKTNEHEKLKQQQDIDKIVKDQPISYNIDSYSQKYSSNGELNTDGTSTISMSLEEIKNIYDKLKGVNFNDAEELSNAIGDEINGIFKNETEEYQKAIINNIKIIEDVGQAFNALNITTENLDKNLSENFLNNMNIGIADGLTEYYAMGMANYSNDDMKNTVNNMSEDTLYEAYAHIIGSNKDDVEEKVNSGDYDIEIIRKAVLTNATQLAAYEKIQDEILNNKDLLTSEKDPYNILERFIASGFNSDSLKGLNEEQAKWLQEMINNNINTNNEIINKIQEIATNSYGNNGFTSDAYQKESQNIQEEKYQSNLSAYSSELGIEKSSLEGYAEYLLETESALYKTKSAALEAAKAHYKFEDAINDVYDVLNDNKDIIEEYLEQEEKIPAYFESLGKVAKSLNELLGGDDIDTDFVETYYEDIKKAIEEGDSEAWDTVQNAALKQWNDNYKNELQSALNEAEGNVIKILNATGAETGEVITQDFLDSFYSNVDAMSDYLTNLENPIDLNMNEQSVVDTIEQMNQLARAGLMTADQMKAAFKKVGYEPEIDMVEGPPQTSHQSGVQTFIDPETGEPFKTLHWENDITTTLSVPAIKDVDGDNKSINYVGVSSPKASKSINKSSGGGGSKSKKDRKSSSDEIERYHEITKVIEDYNDELDDLDKAKDRAWGKSKLDLINKEIAATEKAIDAQEQYIAEIEKNLATDKSNILKYGAEFDEEGNISNWEELMNEQLAIYNAAVDKFNSDQNEEAFEAAEKQYEEFKDLISQYEETEQLYDDALRDKIDQEREAFDLRMELIETELDMEITMSEDTMEYLDYLLDKVERSTYNAAREIAILGRQAKETVSQIESQSDAIHKTLAEVGAEGLFDGLLAGEVSREQLAEAGLTADAIDSIMDSVNEVWSKNLELLDINEQVATAILDDFNQFMEDMDTEISKMEHLISLTESYRNIIELTGQEALGITDELLEAAGQAIVEQNKNILAASKDRLDAVKRERAALAEEIEREKAAGMDTTELEKTLAKMDAEIQEASESFMSAWEEALQSASDQFDQSMEMAIKRFGTAIAGAAGNLDNLQTLMDRQQEIDDRYLEDYAKIYELTKLNRDITNSIDNTDNIKGKQELKKLQEEINALQDGNTQMSQYEVDHLRAKYELRLAEIALEEAQNAKSQVRMTRDAEGNWSYTYTADTDNIDSAQQNYEDKLYALQKLNDEYIEEMSGRMAQIGQEMADALAALDVTASDYQQRYNETTAYYTDQLDYYTQQINISLGNNSELYYNDWKDYSTATGYKLSDAQDYVMQFNDTMLGMATGYQSATQFQTDFNAAIGDVDTEGTLLYDSKQAYEQWKTDVEEIFQEAGTSVEGFKDDYRDFLFDEETGVEKTSKDAAAAVEEMSERMKTAMSNALDAAKTFAEQYSGYMKTATDGLLTFNQQQQEQEEKNKEDEKEQKQKEEEEDKNNKGGSVAPVLRVGAAVALKAGTKGWYDSYGSSPYWVAGSSGTIKYTNEGAPYAYNIDGMGWVKKSDIVGYDTGGYTGAWGSSGKIGMLHEKELVLNQSDTQNFLDGILTLREITDMIDLRASAMGRDSLLGSLTTPAFDNPIVQNIEINAEFPDAVYQDEIKAAFSSLVNEASQYANRKG